MTNAKHAHAKRALWNKRLRATRVDKAHSVRSADAGSSWGEFIPPHPPRTLRVRMFCVRQYKKPVKLHA